MDHSSDARRVIPISIILGLATLGLYLPVLHQPFINYDDPDYVTQNPVVQKGLTWDGLCWAFNGSHAGNWHPVTWLSHMLDAQLYGLNPGGHHFTNVLFHCANTVLLFLFLKFATGATWRSAIVAGLFAFHPVHVESVAWVAERKDVLSGFFGLLTLWAYCRYAAEVKVQNPRSKVYYGAALAAFALGLLSKSMLVTWPCLLLVLDFWPLQRIQIAQDQFPVLARLLIEKIPFFLITLVSCLITYWAQQTGGAVISLDQLTFPVRGANALASYAVYLEKIFWPVKLAVFYPHPAEPPWGGMIFGTAVIGAVSLVAWINLKRRPFLATGWLWYLGTLIPVLGLVQVGIQSYADRYTYLPAIGVFIMLVWGFEGLARTTLARQFIISGAAATLAGCVVLSSIQLGYWKDTKTLFSHAKAVTEANCVAATVLAEELVKEKKSEQAIPFLLEALSYRPNYLDARLWYGEALLELGRYREAEEMFAASLSIAPTSPPAHFGLGSALACQRKFPEAIEQFTMALQLKPDYWEAQLGLAGAEMSARRFIQAGVHLNNLVRVQPKNAQVRFMLGSCLNELGRTNEAQQQFVATLDLDPGFADKLYESGKSLATAGQADAAMVRFSAVLNLNPGFAEAHGNLGMLLAQHGQMERAIPHFREAVRLRPDAQNHYNLALALGIRGDTQAAIAEYRQALSLRPDWPTALNDLAWILATHPSAEVRNGAEAIRLAEKACELSGHNEPRFLGTLDACYAEAGRFDKAIATARKAQQMAVGSGQKEVAEAAAARIKLYESSRPYRQ